MSRSVVVILGMHRAGTSLTSKIAAHLGARLGDDLLPPRSDNPDGLWEHAGIIKASKAINAVLNRRAMSPTGSLPFPPGWARAAAVAPHAEQLRRILEAECGKPGGVFAFKDPNTVRLLPLWRRIFEELEVTPRYLLSVRHPGAVARSLRERDRITLNQGELLWTVHYADAIRSLEGRFDAVVHYEGWLKEPLPQAKLMIERLELPWSGDDSQLEALLAENIDSGLQHHAVRPAITSPLVDSLYDVLREWQPAEPWQRKATTRARRIREATRLLSPWSRALENLSRGNVRGALRHLEERSWAPRQPGPPPPVRRLAESDFPPTATPQRLEALAPTICLVMPESSATRAVLLSGCMTEEVRLFLLGQSLAAAGCRVTLLFPKRNPLATLLEAAGNPFLGGASLDGVSPEASSLDGPPRVPTLVIDPRPAVPCRGPGGRGPLARALESSYNVYEYLKTRSFDIVHFSTGQGVGFFSTQAKSQGLNFQNTTLSLLLSAPALLRLEQDHRLLDDLPGLIWNHMEEETARLADVVVSSTDFLYGWLAARGYRLQTNRCRIHPTPLTLPAALKLRLREAVGGSVRSAATRERGHNLTLPGPSPAGETAGETAGKTAETDGLETAGVETPESGVPESGVPGSGVPESGAAEPSPAEALETEASAMEGADPAARRPVSGLIFVGDLDQRNGIHIFCDALARLVAAGLPPRRVCFVSPAAPGAQVREVRERLAPLELPLSFLTDPDIRQRLALYGEPEMLAVLPALQEELHPGLAECLELGLPLLVGNVGGSAELIHPDDRDDASVEPHPYHLAERLILAFREGQAPPRAALSADALQDVWLRWHAELVEQKADQQAAGDLVGALEAVNERLYAPLREETRRLLAPGLLTETAATEVAADPADGAAETLSGDAEGVGSENARAEDPQPEHLRSGTGEAAPPAPEADEAVQLPAPPSGEEALLAEGPAEAAPAETSDPDADALPAESSLLADDFLARDDLPLVSVCLIHHERPEMVNHAVESLLLQSYPRIEVILVDDGSRSEAAIYNLEYLSALFAERGWQVYRQPNLSPGAARNRAAGLARGEYLLFMDDDNYAKPHEVETFVRVALTTNADAITCFRDSFVGDDLPPLGQLARQRIAAMGSSISVGVFVNCFGDTNALIRRSVYERVGGYTEHHRTGKEDFEFFCKIALGNHKFITIPEALYWYRETRVRRRRFHYNANAGLLTVLNSFALTLPASLRDLVLYGRALQERNAELQAQLDRMGAQLARQAPKKQIVPLARQAPKKKSVPGTKRKPFGRRLLAAVNPIRLTRRVLRLARSRWQ